jgi:hypothetical protein
MAKDDELPAFVVRQTSQSMGADREGAPIIAIHDRGEAEQTSGNPGKVDCP